MTEWTAARAFAACTVHPGLRALVVCDRPARCRDSFESVRALLLPEVAVERSPGGYVLRFPNGSVLRLATVVGCSAVRRLAGAIFQLVVFDGLEENDRLYLASLVRAPADSGVAVLGIHEMSLT